MPMKNIKRIGVIIAIFIIGATGGIFASEILWPSLVEAPLYNGYGAPGEQPKVEQTKRVTVKENEALQDVIQETKSSAVAIKGKKNGTGFITTSDGVIVTLKSIADSTTTVIYNGEELEASVIKTGETFTSLKIDKNNLPTQGIADIEKTYLGERVFLVGNLFKEEVIKAVNHGIVKYRSSGKIYTNIREPEGLTGAPVLNIEGEVVGLTKINEQNQVVAEVLPEINDLVE